MDAYSGYKYINMDQIDAPKMTFMSNHGNYYYKVMLLTLKTMAPPILGSWMCCYQRKYGIIWRFALMT